MALSESPRRSPRLISSRSAIDRREALATNVSPAPLASPASANPLDSAQRAANFPRHVGDLHALATQSSNLGTLSQRQMSTHSNPPFESTQSRRLPGGCSTWPATSQVAKSECHSRLPSLTPSPVRPLGMGCPRWAQERGPCTS